MSNDLRLKDINYDELSPMMQLYADLKKNMMDTIIFYRLGDFYEMFFDDALYVAPKLELALTQRDCGSNKRAPMCGVPHHAYLNYANRLVAMGEKVAICEQLEDPALAKGLVKRGIVKIMTPGTMTDSSGLDEHKNNYLMSVMCIGSQFGVAVADISTGEFNATQLTSSDNGEHFMNLVSRYMPSEIIHNEAFAETPEYKTLVAATDISFTLRSERDFSSAEFKNSRIIVVDNIHFPDPGLMFDACNALVLYARHTQTCDVDHMTTVNVFKISDTMELDKATRTNLEITSTIRGNTRKGSLLSVIDKTKTAMGSRLLRKWLEEPLINVRAINKRLDAVNEIYDNYISRMEITEGLTGLYDIERLAAKVSLGTSNARDLISLRNSLGKLPFIAKCLEPYGKGVFKDIKRDLDTMEDICELLEKSIADDPPVTITDGDIIREGFSKERDELYDIATNAKGFIMQKEAGERERTGIKTLKIGYNKVFGYYIEVPRSQSENVPEEYIRKQTLANNERYITPDIKELEDKIVGASAKRIALEYELFCEIRNTVKAASDRLFATARAIALLDVISSLANLASSENYVRPIVDDSEDIVIEEGRHPVVEKMIKDASGFVPNDTLIDEEKRLCVLTGPNMSGKSTYMRQIALIVLLAQIGSYVPAKSARIGLVDHIFTRIGASDDISVGQSTFMVEMSEVSYILKNATRKSLLLLDEVGRGTSTYDGLSIAWAVTEYIIDPNILYARTVFATHYHELNQLSLMHRGIFNCHVEVAEDNDSVVFLHKILEGGTSDSYGIEVAKLAGIPDGVLERSRAILSELERIGDFKVLRGHKQDSEGNNELVDSIMPGQDSFFNPENVVYRKEDKIRQTIKSIDISKLTPIEAINILYDLSQQVAEEGEE
jgi:DNA mismatch repair protein MutS